MKTVRPRVNLILEVFFLFQKRVFVGRMCYVNITITAKFFEEICSSLFPSMISPGLIGELQVWRWYVVTKLYAYISWPDFQSSE